jgi:hypothetical protein
MAQAPQTKGPAAWRGPFVALNWSAGQGFVLEAPPLAGLGVPLGAGRAGTVPPGLAGGLADVPVTPPPAGSFATPGAVGGTEEPLGDGVGAAVVGRLLLGELTGACVDWAMAAAGTIARPATMAIVLIIRLFSVRSLGFK